MPEKQTIKRAKQDLREGKSPTTAGGEFVREEIHHVREGKHGARSPKQAIAIGLSKARRAGVPVPPRGRRKASVARKRTVSAKRATAVRGALEREPRKTASKTALSRQAKSAARKRSASSRSAAARKASRTKGATVRSTAAKKAAATRKRRTRR